MRNAGPIPHNLWGAPEGPEGLRVRPRQGQGGLRQGARPKGAPIDREVEIHIQQQLAQTTQAAQMLQQDLRKIGVNAQDRAEPVAQSRRLDRQARDHARHVGALGRDLLRRSGELDRPDVRQPVPRHLEGVVLVQERQGRPAAARGARHRRPGQAPGLYEEASRIVVADARRHLGLQHRADPRHQRARAGLQVLARSAAAASSATCRVEG